MSWDFVAIAAEACMRAGAIQKARYGQDIEVMHKGTINLVTEVDKECEAVILETIRARFPDHDVVSEETDFGRTGSRHVWFVDPLDGTTNFAHGYPCFAATVALAVGGEIVAGAVYDPLHGDLYTGERGAGAHHNGGRMHVSSSAELITSLLITGFPYDIHDDTAAKLTRFCRLMSQARAIRRDGSAAVDLCLVADGCADGFWEDRLQPWDMLAGNLMIEEAGGRVSRYDGGPVSLGPDELAATNGALHEALLAVIRG